MQFDLLHYMSNYKVAAYYSSSKKITFCKKIQSNSSDRKAQTDYGTDALRVMLTSL